MNLYIETENGVTKNHPAFEDNLIQAFGGIPDHWEPFTRVAAPTLGVYEVLDSNVPTYSKVDGVWTDAWTKRDMTEEEKSAKQQIVHDAWAVRPNASNYTAWIFDEATCSYIPPIPRPTDRQVFWQGSTNSFVDLPPYPDDEKNYRLDFDSASWVLVEE
jgi:hypothetical protein